MLKRGIYGRHIGKPGNLRIEIAGRCDIAKCIVGVCRKSQQTIMLFPIVVCRVAENRRKKLLMKRPRL